MFCATKNLSTSKGNLIQAGDLFEIRGKVLHPFVPKNGTDFKEKTDYGQLHNGHLVRHWILALGTRDHIDHLLKEKLLRMPTRKSLPVPPEKASNFTMAGDPSNRDVTEAEKAVRTKGQRDAESKILNRLKATLENSNKTSKTNEDDEAEKKKETKSSSTEHDDKEEENKKETKSSNTEHDDKEEENKKGTKSSKTKHDDKEEKNKNKGTKSSKTKHDDKEEENKKETKSSKTKKHDDKEEENKKGTKSSKTKHDDKEEKNKGTKSSKTKHDDKEEENKKETKSSKTKKHDDKEEENKKGTKSSKTKHDDKEEKNKNKGTKSSKTKHDDKEEENRKGTKSSKTKHDDKEEENKKNKIGAKVNANTNENKSKTEKKEEDMNNDEKRCASCSSLFTIINEMKVDIEMIKEAVIGKKKKQQSHDHEGTIENQIAFDVNSPAALKSAGKFPEQISSGMLWCGQDVYVAVKKVDRKLLESSGLQAAVTGLMNLMFPMKAHLFGLKPKPNSGKIRLAECFVSSIHGLIDDYNARQGGSVNLKEADVRAKLRHTLSNSKVPENEKKETDEDKERNKKEGDDSEDDEGNPNSGDEDEEKNNGETGGDSEDNSHVDNSEDDDKNNGDGNGETDGDSKDNIHVDSSEDDDNNPNSGDEETIDNTGTNGGNYGGSKSSSESDSVSEDEDSGDSGDSETDVSGSVTDEEGKFKDMSGHDDQWQTEGQSLPDFFEATTEEHAAVNRRIRRKLLKH
ncbi:uncharacterized protein DDB_G0290685-like [Thrips palmi]|uniref:Uncharacterized protein DDB_G0290685-like n=1 Tax=Thrips palmi TaxID=161013 RepID=A0A6P8YKB1_THRPL|nr:uncharacterized protein DDB_G0290685-like [Thrips palmi]